MIRPADAPASAVAPHNPEVSVLGACLQDFAAAKTACELLTPGDFFSAIRAEVFGIVGTLVEQGIPPDKVMVFQAAVDRKAQDRVTGTLLLDIESNVPTAANVAHHARIVRELATRRRAADAMIQAREAILADGADVPAILAEHQERLNGLAVARSRHSQAPLIRAYEVVADPATFAIDPLAAQRMLTNLSGKDKRGKTLLALEMVKAFLLGERFLGTFPVNGGGPVAAYLLDDPDSLTIDRLKTLGILDHQHLYVATPTNVDLSDPFGFLDDVAVEVRRLRASFVLLDALYLLTPSGIGAQNDTAKMGPIMRALNLLAEDTDAAVLLIAHDRKDGGDVAGSHVIRAAAKGILRLDLPRTRGGDDDGEDDAPQTPRRILKLESKMVAAQSWTLEILGSKDLYEGWRCHGAPWEARAADCLALVQAHVLAGGRGTTEDIAKAIKRQRADVDRAIAALLDRGVVEVVPQHTGGRGRPAKHYRAADRPAEFASGDLFPSDGRDGNSKTHSRRCAVSWPAAPGPR